MALSFTGKLFQTIGFILGDRKATATVVVEQGSLWVSWFLIRRNFMLLPEVSELLGDSSSPGETESR